jgi:hypothetical protein
MNSRFLIFLPISQIDFNDTLRIERKHMLLKYSKTLLQLVYWKFLYTTESFHLQNTNCRISLVGY